MAKRSVARALALSTMLATSACAQTRQTSDAPPPTSAPSTQPIRQLDLFDPARHMRVSEVREGMKGYGLSVFHGTAIEKFDVEVVAVLKNFNPKADAVFIRCHGQNLEHTGAIQGMSGSPIYLYDDTGKARMIGAFAYGFSLSKDPLAGVQPIEYMVRFPEGERAATTPPLTALTPSPGTQGEGGHLTVLRTPLAFSGIPASVIEQNRAALKSLGLTPLQTGGGATTAATQESPPKLEPGSSLVSPLMTGDIDAAVVGTVTEVIGDRVFGFGHPFNNEGPIELPMGTGRINAIVAVLTSSFKMGSLVDLKGALVSDRNFGVIGVTGHATKFVPATFHVIYEDGSVDQTFNVQIARHVKFTPLLAGMALSAALSGQHEPPPDHVLDYDIDLAFDNGKTLRIHDRATSVIGDGLARAPVDLRPALLLPLMQAAENPFQSVLPSRINATIRLSRTIKSAAILSANLSRTTFRAGETLRATLSYRPYQGVESALPIEFTLPKDLADGSYQLTISDAGSYLAAEVATKPFRFQADGIDAVFETMQDISSIRNDAVYVRLTRAADGIAVGRVAMPHLPVSKRTLLTNAGRSDTTAFASTETKIVPTDLIFSGSADFAIKVDSNRHVELAGAKKPEPAVTPPPAVEKPKAEPPANKPVKSSEPSE